ERAHQARGVCDGRRSPRAVLIVSRVHLPLDLRRLWTAAAGGDGVRRACDCESSAEHKRIRGANCFGHGFQGFRTDYCRAVDRSTSTSIAVRARSQTRAGVFLATYSSDDARGLRPSAEENLEAAAVFGRDDECPHHFGVNKVAVEFQLAKPVVETVLVRITAQVPEIFHEDKHMVEFFIEKRLPVRRVENRKSASGRGCSI